MKNIDELLDQLLEKIQGRLSAAELQWFHKIGETLKKIYELPADQINDYAYSLEYRETISADLRKLNNLLKTAHIENIQDIESMFDNLITTVYENGQEIAELKKQGLSSKAIYRKTVTPLLRKTMRDYTIMAKSTTTDKIYRDTMRKMVNKMTINSEKTNYHQAMRAAVTELSQQGISYVHYDNKKHPYTRRLDSSVRVSLSGEMNQVVQTIQNKLASEIGADSFEITVEHASAPDHEGVQGKIFEAAEFEKLQSGESAVDIDGETHILEKRAIGQYNCRHGAMPFLLGISEPSYSREELDMVNRTNKEGIEFDGEKMSLYSATQWQRANETEQRRERGKLEIIRQVAGNDPAFRQDMRESQARIKELRTDYARLGKVLEPHGINMKHGRKYNINARGFR